MNWTNYHNHCNYCDGKESIETHVRAAIDQDVFSLGFSSHCPVPFQNTWSMKKEQINLYFNEIEVAQKIYADQIAIYKSLEIDFIPGVITPNDDFIKDLKLDYTLGSVHFVGKFEDGQPWEIDGPHGRFLLGLQNIYHGDIKTVILNYYELIRQMVREACPDIIGHIDKIKMQNYGLWDEEAHWYQEAIRQTLEEVKSSGAIIEVNTRGLYKKLSTETYPGNWVLRQIKKMNIPIQINSDAHLPREITNLFNETADQLLTIGLQKVKILHNNEWIYVNMNKNGLTMS